MWRRAVLYAGPSHIPQSKWNISVINAWSKEKWPCVHLNLTASFICCICCRLTDQELMENAVSKMPPKNIIINKDFWECLPHPPFSPAMMGANTYCLFISSEINTWYTDGLKTSAMHSWKYLLSSLHKVQTARMWQDSFLLKFVSYIQQVVNFVRKQSCCIITACYYTKAYNEHFCLNTLLWPVNMSIKDSFFWCY